MKPSLPDPATGIIKRCIGPNEAGVLSLISQAKSLKRSPVVGDLYGTGSEIWAGFGPVGITEKKEIWADYEQLLRPFFFKFSWAKKE